MKLLLDTNALAWALTEVNLLTRRSRNLIAEEANEVLISAASCWEIATKVRLGKWDDLATVEVDLLTVIQNAGYRILAITGSVALRAGRFPGKHGDPFDRMIAAHAALEDAVIISPDSHLDTFGVRRVW